MFAELLFYYTQKGLWSFAIHVSIVIRYVWNMIVVIYDHNNRSWTEADGYSTEYDNLQNIQSTNNKMQRSISMKKCGMPS